MRRTPSGAEPFTRQHADTHPIDPSQESTVTYVHEYLSRSRQQELIDEAQRARLITCLRPDRPWRRRGRRRA